MIISLCVSRGFTGRYVPLLFSAGVFFCAAGDPLPTDHLGPPPVLKSVSLGASVLAVRGTRTK